MKFLHQYSDLRDFLILWSSQAVSSLGTAMTNYALIIWTYSQKGTASSITLLSLFSYLPSILFCFAAGTLADRWNKKNIMLLSDTVAALGTVTIFVLYNTNSLQIWHLYGINFLLSFMNAFQDPAAYVAESLLIPKQYYIKASGLQALSNSLITVMTPALATAVLAFGGIQTVFSIDLITFGIAFTALLFFIQIPSVPNNAKVKEPFLEGCFVGLNFLRKNKPLLHLVFFFSFINLLTFVGGGGSLVSAMILARTNQNQTILGVVSSAIGIGTLVGSILVTLAKPSNRRTKVVFIACGISFLLCDVLLGLGRNTAIWMFAAFSGNLPVPFINANLTSIMRTKVPVEMQGRVISARNTLQHCTIPLGLFLGGFLADRVFEPFMLNPSPAQQFLSFWVGTGKGSGIAVMFLITGFVGGISSLFCLSNKTYQELDE